MAKFSVSRTVSRPNSATFVSEGGDARIETKTFARPAVRALGKAPSYVAGPKGLVLGRPIGIGEDMSARLLRLKNEPPASIFDDPGEMMRSLGH
jgi:hypothetical protein